MFDPYKVCAVFMEVFEDYYGVKIDWKLIRKSDGSIVTGPQAPATAQS